MGQRQGRGPHIEGACFGGQGASLPVFESNARRAPPEVTLGEDEGVIWAFYPSLPEEIARFAKRDGRRFDGVVAMDLRALNGLWGARGPSRGLWRSLRALDRRGVNVISVERAVDHGEGP